MDKEKIKKTIGKLSIVGLVAGIGLTAGGG